MSGYTHLDSCYFSIKSNLIDWNSNLPFQIFLNSSTHKKNKRYVCFFKPASPVDIDYLINLQTKTPYFYLNENDRCYYYHYLTQQSGLDNKKKVSLLKESCLTNLKDFFHQAEKAEENFPLLLNQSKAFIESMFHFLKDKALKDVFNLIQKLHFYDAYTFDHSLNTALYTLALYPYMEPEIIGTEEYKNNAMNLGLGALLHDIGKLNLPLSILNKVGSLEDWEFKEIKKHPTEGQQLFKSTSASFNGHLKDTEDISEREKKSETKGIYENFPSPFPLEKLDLDIIGRIVNEHHENVDGTGYPQGKKDGEIHLFSQIVSLADCLDALTTPRSYHNPLNLEDALKLMSKSRNLKWSIQNFDSFYQTLLGKPPVGPKKGSTMLLAADYDPCRPWSEIPLESYSPKTSQNKGAFGKIKIKLK